MKNIQKIVVTLIVLTCCLTACGQQHRRPQQSQRQLTSVTVTKRQTGYCQARIWQGPENTLTNMQRVAEYASAAYMRTGRVPSESELTQHFGFRTQARWVDTPDKVVKSITVQPSELPDNIRRRFQ